MPLVSHLLRQRGLEPLTYCLEGSCSIQLSYWRTFKDTEVSETWKPYRKSEKR